MSSDPRNPLLGLGFRIPFDRIGAAEVEPAVDGLLGQAQADLEALAAAERTFSNLMLGLDSLTERLDNAMAVVRHLESVATSPELRAAYSAVQPKVSAFYSKIPLHAGLWRAIKEYAETEEAKALTGVRKRFLDKTMDSFRRHGADLDRAGKVRLEAIDVELAGLTVKFAQNVLDATNAFELMITEESRLAGLPPSAVEAARETAAAKELAGWRFTLQAPSYHAVMTYLDDASVREQVYRAYNRRGAGGAHDNTGILERILELRNEKANLLGYRDFADFVLADRMARDGERAWLFLEDLRRKTEIHFRRENRELASFRRRLEGENAPDPAPWDIAYIAEKQRAALYEFDEEALRPYFPLERVVVGMFEICHRLHGIRVVEKTGMPSWDPRTSYYEIRDGDGTLLGAFYADWYPRENKRGGAWMEGLLTGRPCNGGFEPHLGVICGNVTPPVGSKPALLTHREVETVFHEFGHLLHHCLSRVEIRSFAGTSVAWDFVELPSQIMENWCWEREALDLFARHWETGAPIPDELYGKMKRARTYRSANAQMRQLGFGFLDLALHREYRRQKDGDLLGYCRRVLAEFSPALLEPDYAMIAAFTHLFSNVVGYAAGYYSYKWAEVLDADAFTRFRAQGIFSPEAGAGFREKILARGDGEDPALLYRAFMGRDPDPGALMERLGLNDQNPPA